MPTNAPEMWMRPTKALCRAAALLALVALNAPVAAQTSTPAPQAPGAAFDVKGFRSAIFGMTPAQVRTAIADDFGAERIAATANPTEGTTALQVVLTKLDPGPGAATLTYIFGATSKRLAHVNIVWALDGDPTPAQRESLVAAAVQLTNYFQSLPPPKASTGVTPAGPNGLVMFAAVDAKGAAVEIAANGISYQADSAQRGSGSASPDPKGPALLRISYVANAANPDVLRIKPGQF